jgi:hypothetical protein
MSLAGASSSIITVQIFSMEIYYKFLRTRILFYPQTPPAGGGYKNIDTKKSPLGDLGVILKQIYSISQEIISRQG